MKDFGSYYRDPFDIQSVEVLKGPASVMFGHGLTGSIINEAFGQAQVVPITAGTLAFGTDGTKRTIVDVEHAPPGFQTSVPRLNLMVNDGGVADRDNARNRRFGIAPELAFGGRRAGFPMEPFFGPAWILRAF